ncbi:hypothetical protein OROHE_005989 [Orobanche hederae]
MPSREILKIRDGTPLEAEEILTYIKKPSKRIEISKIRVGTPLELDAISRNFKNSCWYPFGGRGNFDIHKKSPQNESFCYFSSKLDVPSNVVRKKRVARILFSKIRPSQEISKIRVGTPLEAEEILTYIKKPSKRIEILKIRDGTPLEAEEILTYIKKPTKWIEILKIRDGTPLEKRVAGILFSKIRPFREILKMRDGTPFGGGGNFDIHKKALETDRPSREILKIRYDAISRNFKNSCWYPFGGRGNFDIHKKSPQNESFCYFSSKLDVPSNVVRKKRVARILFSKIRPSREISKIRVGTPLEAEEILTYIKKPSKRIGLPSREILKIRDGTPLEMPSREILKIRDGTPLEKKRVAGILFSKIRPFREILKMRDGTPFGGGGNFDIHKKALETDRVARILFSKIRPSREIFKIRDGTPFGGGGNFDIHKKALEMDRPSQEISKIRVGTPLEMPSREILKIRYGTHLEMPSREILKIRDGTPLEMPSREILKIRDGTPLEAEEILTYIKKPTKWIVARILFSKIRPSREILKIRDGTPLEAISRNFKNSCWYPFGGRGNFDIHKKSPQNESFCYFSSKLDVPSNVVRKKRVARILLSKIRPSREILKIRDGTPLETEEILTYIKKPSKRIEILKIRDGTPLEMPSREILKIRDGTPLEAEEILTYIKKPSKRIEISKIRVGTPLEAEEILTYIKKALKTNRFVTFLAS